MDSSQSTLDRFFAQAAAAPRRALLLDYDGTLAPFQVERDQALPYAGVGELLAALLRDGQTRVVIVSGRAVADLSRLLGLDPLPELWGSHGWERRLADGVSIPPELSEQARAGLEAAYAAAQAHGLEHVLERKPVSIAAHWRGLTPRAAAALQLEVGGHWGPIAARYRLALHPFDGGLELRVPGRDKGTAVRTVLDELGPGACVAYLGDDLTDEDAFVALGAQGLGVLVREERRPSAATLWLRPPEELLGFLSRWASPNFI